MASEDILQPTILSSREAWPNWHLEFVSLANDLDLWDWIQNPAAHPALEQPDRPDLSNFDTAPQSTQLATGP